MSTQSSTLITHTCVWLSVLLHPIISENYFTYNDCKYECIETNTSCTITEVIHDFINICVNSAQYCEQTASSTRVCLRPNLPPIGGEDIWVHYKERYPTSTTTETPHKQDKVIQLELTIEGALLALFMLTTLIAITILYKTPRMQPCDATIPILADSPINNDRPDNIYNPTIQ